MSQRGAHDIDLILALRRDEEVSIHVAAVAHMGTRP
jgi:hypothetical protein